MRVAVVATSLVASAIAWADASLPSAREAPDTPAWMARCRARLELFRRDLVELYPNLAPLQVQVGRQERPARDWVVLESPGLARVRATVAHGPVRESEEPELWHSFATSDGGLVAIHTRYRKSGEVWAATPTGAGAAVLNGAKPVVDACLDDAPTEPHPWTADEPDYTKRCQRWVNPAACIKAEKAVRWIEGMNCYDYGGGYSARIGEGWLALRDIVALGPDAHRYLERLAASSNPVARFAAAEAVRMRRLATERPLVERLVRDRARVDDCGGAPLTVSVGAWQALAALAEDEARPR